jgi:hypothetical protein
MQNHEQKKKWKKVKKSEKPRFYGQNKLFFDEQKKKVKKSEKSEKPRFYGQNKLFFEHPSLQPLGKFSHMAACKSSSENTWKMSLIPVFNKNSPRAHTESELDVLGVHGKLVKYEVHSYKRINWKKIIFVHTSCPNSNRPVFGLKEF